MSWRRHVAVVSLVSLVAAIAPSVTPTICDIACLRERGGEGVSWVDASELLLLTSEGRRGTISLVACPLPEPGA